jgi:predicted Zn finger-like uncharacterized protein
MVSSASWEVTYENIAANGRRGAALPHVAKREFGSMAMAKHTVECPQCGASYKIDETKLGKKGRCSKCGNNFTLALSSPDPVEPLVAEVVDEQPSGDPLSSLAAASTAQSTATPPPPVSAYPQAAAPGGPSRPTRVGLSRLCLACGYQGYMGKKWPGWVVPVAIITAFFTVGLGLLLLFVPKKLQCPQCGTFFGE